MVAIASAAINTAELTKFDIDEPTDTDIIEDPTEGIIIDHTEDPTGGDIEDPTEYEVRDPTTKVDINDLAKANIENVTELDAKLVPLGWTRIAYYYAGNSHQNCPSGNWIRTCINGKYVYKPKSNNPGCYSAYLYFTQALLEATRKGPQMLLDTVRQIMASICSMWMEYPLQWVVDLVCTCGPTLQDTAR